MRLLLTYRRQRSNTLGQFGMYIMFPIGIMYYFGTNLDEKFSTPDFWPKKEQTHTIPFERKEIDEEIERLKARRLAARARRIGVESNSPSNTTLQSGIAANPTLAGPLVQSQETTEQQHQTPKEWLSWLR